MAKRVIILTTGQPSTNPRMIKEYSALKSKGYCVKVFYSYWEKWASLADENIFRLAGVDKKDFYMVAGSPLTNKLLYFFSKLLYKFNSAINTSFGLNKSIAASRTSLFLMKAALREPAELFIAHNIGALPAAVISAKKAKAKVGFDAEDFHRGEFQHENSKLCKLVKLIEDEYIPHCNYVSAASPLIAQAYAHLFPNLKFVVINNVFSATYLKKKTRTQIEPTLKLFWFSQTVGKNRGIEDIIYAINLLDEIPVTLTLLGKCSEATKNYFINLTKKAGRGSFIKFVPPVTIDELFSIANQHDIGLGTETPYIINRDLCLTNKIFTYILSGNALILSDTHAQKIFMKEHENIGLQYSSGDPNSLAVAIKYYYDNPDILIQHQSNSLRLAKNQCNWEKEQQKFLELISEVLS